MSRISRIIIALASVGLSSIYFVPLWFIFLIAPQYPEGLTMNIWLNRISGQVDIINGLNHYIGMKHIKAEMFPEFTYLIYILAFFILFGIVIAITGKRQLLFAYLIVTVVAGVAAMYDFYKWGYDYGHNLDPKAAIQVPGLYYQPPLIGHKTLLNFDAYSYPDLGGWIIIAISMVFFLVWFFEWKRNRKPKEAYVTAPIKNVSLVALSLIFLVSSCTTKPQPIAYGKDNCEDCMMTIIDPKFGGEVITKKGRVYKFDDAHCLAHYLNAGKIKEADIARTVFINYNDNNDFLDVKSAFFVVSPRLKSPMNGNTASFLNKDAAELKAKELNGSVKSWEEVNQILK